MNEKELTEDPPAEPIWWVSDSGRVKCRTWFEARERLGGNPVRLLDQEMANAG